MIRGEIMNQELNLWREKTKGLFNITEYKRFWNYISNLQQDTTMYAQLKDEYEEEIEDLKENNEVLLSSYKAQKDINHQQLSMVIKRDKKIKDLQQENERLKETNVYCNRTDCVGRIKDSKKYDSVYQEKEDCKLIIEKLTKELKTTYNKEYYYKYNGKYLKSEINTELLNLLESRGN